MYCCNSYLKYAKNFSFDTLIKGIVESDRHAVLIAQELNIAEITILDHLKNAGSTKKVDILVSQELRGKNFITKIYTLPKLNKYR